MNDRELVKKRSPGRRGRDRERERMDERMKSLEECVRDLKIQVDKNSTRLAMLVGTVGVLVTLVSGLF